MMTVDKDKRPSVEEIMSHPRISISSKEYNFKEIMAIMKKK